MDPRAIVDKMYDNDPFSQWLGIEILDVRPGYCKLRMEVSHAMTNGFGLAHGGISYSLADSALAFASNSRGRHAVSVETSINHLEKIKAGDQLLAEVKEVALKNNIGFYRIDITSKDKAVAVFNGTVFRTNKTWE